MRVWAAVDWDEGDEWWVVKMVVKGGVSMSAV